MTVQFRTHINVCENIVDNTCRPLCYTVNLYLNLTSKLCISLGFFKIKLLARRSLPPSKQLINLVDVTDGLSEAMSAYG